MLCMIVRWVFALLVRLLRGVNLIPLVGGANRLLGLVLGLVTDKCCKFWCCIPDREPSGVEQQYNQFPVQDCYLILYCHQKNH